MGDVTSIHAVRRGPAARRMETEMERRLGQARFKLIETGTRNRLIHTPRKRTRAIPLHGNGSDALFKTLVRDHKALPFLPTPEIKEIQREAARLKAPRLVTGKTGFRNGIQTALPIELLHKRLSTIFRDAKTAEEERGVNILFLALGFLRWYEDETSEVLREAPLILLPIALLRDGRHATFAVKLREDDLTANQALQERLRDDFGLMLPGLPEGDDWLPSDYFDAVCKAIAPKGRWSIDANAMQFEFYSFSKLLMVRDLDPANWPNNELSNHPLLRGLLIEGFAAEPPVLPETANLDELPSPLDLVQVVDADSSQTRVIETVRAGRNLVVQGPPGTGKSQTITNIIAAAVHDGRTVLFVAEKMAALNVVHERLRATGLDEICIELHSQSANKRLVAERLEATLQSPLRTAENQETAKDLAEVRDSLNRITRGLHTEIGRTAITPHQALTIQIAAAAKGFTPDAQLVEEARNWTAVDFLEKARLTQRLADLTESFGPLNHHPYFGVGSTSLQPSDFLRQLPRLKALADKAADLATHAAMLANYFGLNSDPTFAGVKSLAAIFKTAARLPRGTENLAAAIAQSAAPHRIIELAALGVEWQSQQAPYLHIFQPAAWTTSVRRLHAPLAKGAAFWLYRASKAYREASDSLAGLLRVPLPRQPAERLALVDALLASQALHARLMAETGSMANVLEDVWRNKKAAFHLILETAEIVETLTSFDPHLNLQRIFGFAHDGSAAARAERLEASLDEVIGGFTEAVRFLDLDLPGIFETHAIARIDLNRLSERAALWARSKDRFEDWARLAKADREARAFGRERMACALARADLDPKFARLEIETAFAEACWKNAIAADAGLANLDGDRRAALVARFQSLEAQARKAAIDRVRARHSANIPRGAQGGMGVIRAEICRKRGHMPLRKLMKVAGSTIQKIKPVFLMSPISVAQFLPPGAIDFDLLVIDEASQLRPEDALGLIARCRQIVVVGDKKQLPPTRFFDRMISSDTETEDGEGEGEEDDLAARPANGTTPVTDLESILSLCEARGLETQMLRWHYRSRHPSLIEVSNAEFYHRLIMPPAPVLERNEMGLKLTRVRGAYDRGGKRTNRIEAQAIAEAVSLHARLDPDRSLGIITFSTAQRDLIGDTLEIRRREDRSLDSFLSRTGPEEAFVKNLENVQGDERDVILISIGYGPREAGQPLDSMAFGPISAEDGERRLNVLFTRARLRCEVFVSFHPTDINLDRAQGEGPRLLKRFLQYAESGLLEAQRPSGADFDSAFEEAVAEAIENLGFKVEPQVGSAGFKIDLAVRDRVRLGRYLLAVECDGARYHSALWARERDRLRQQVLENLGWRFHRIWSTDWFYRRTEQIEKLRSVLAEAQAESQCETELAQPPPAIVSQDGQRMQPASGQKESEASCPPVQKPRKSKIGKSPQDPAGPARRSQRPDPHPEAPAEQASKVDKETHSSKSACREPAEPRAPQDDAAPALNLSNSRRTRRKRSSGALAPHPASPEDETGPIHAGLASRTPPDEGLQHPRQPHARRPR
ncbi:MAG TPA: DUF4011 domain-containing protein [Methylocella sp.]|nr:DUF4011 domain-containing protein [Methylocella sp.]